MRGRAPSLPPRSRRDGRIRMLRDRDASGPRAAMGPCDPLPQVAPRTLRDALLAAEALLDCVGVSESVADARLLLAHALEASPTWVFAHEHDPLSDDAWCAYRTLVSRRAERVPLQHLLGVQDFWSLRLQVTPDVLIPRPETELLVESAVAALGSRGPCRIADVGTGSGAIAIAIASELPQARVLASDVSAAALSVARANARAHGFEDRVIFLEGSLTAPLRDSSHGEGGVRLDGLVANLPYVTTSEWEQLEPEVRDHEPRHALVGGEDGLDLVRQLVAEAPSVLVPGGLLALEVGHAQAAATIEALERAGFRDLKTRRDLAGVERVVEGRA